MRNSGRREERKLLRLGHREGNRELIKVLKESRREVNIRRIGR
jgi:hypothetical protein